MAKKLYVVTVSIEVEALVLAESEAEAVKAEREIMRTEDLMDASRSTATPLKSMNGKPLLPNAWDETSLVYGADDDLPVGEALKLYPPEPVEQKRLL